MLVLALAALSARAQTVPPDPPAVPVANLDEAFARLNTYTLGQDYTPCKYIGEQVLAAQGHLDQRNALADRLAQVLTSDAPWDAKVFASQKLYLIATEQQVDTLAPLLTDEKLGDLARYAIEQIPGERVTNALLAALDKATGKARIGIVNSLGARRDVVAEDRVSAFLSSEDAEMVRAAAQVWGVISDPEKKIPQSNPAFYRSMEVGYLLRIERLRDEARTAVYAYAIAGDHDFLMPITLRGLIESNNKDALEWVVKFLHDPKPARIHLGLGLIAKLRDESTAKKLLTEARKTSGDTKAGLLYALAARPDLKIDDLDTRSALSTALKDPDQPVRVAALAALARVGDALALDEILKFAVAAEGTERKAAAEVLATMQDHDIEELRKTLYYTDAITQRLHEVATEAAPQGAAEIADTDGLTPEEREKRHQTARVLAINALAARYATGTYSSMIFLAQDKNPEVATAAIDAIGDLATDDYLVDALVLLNDETDPARRVQLEDTIVKALHRLGTASGAARNLVRVLDLTPSAPMKESVRKIMGELGMPLPAASAS